jgi:hypothetical protein
MRGCLSLVQVDIPRVEFGFLLFADGLCVAVWPCCSGMKSGSVVYIY